MAELGEFELKAESKLAVDVEMLEYEYIEKCNDPEKLRAIVEVLKSGKEGFYPDVSFHLCHLFH
jgi:sperm-associated antigen 1